ncbi:MAG: hypothetical protein EOM73_05480 [Bacteroidia bacterium]|nr:hypothetical protein [Bacteroidia bacterium]
MKKIGLFLVAVFFGTSLSMAQPGGQGGFNPETMAKRQTAELKEALGLNADQEKKVYDMNLETSKKMGIMREKMQAGGNAMEGMREKMTQIRADQDKKMKEILTADQWAKYQKYKEERRIRRGQGGGPGGNR